MNIDKNLEQGTGDRRFGLSELAQFFAASWVLSGKERRMIASRGIVDSALYDMVKAKTLPAQVAKELNFARTAVGLRCGELQGALDEAQSLTLAAAPNPSYEFIEFRIDPYMAKLLLSDIGVSPEEASAAGTELRRLVSLKMSRTG